MYSQRRLSQVLKSAFNIPIDNTSKIILMSDCHRGDGSWADDFSKNQTLYFAALSHYYNQGYTYIELGDGDELWKNTRLYDILHVHSNVFLLLSQFYRENRLYFIYGNHDMVKTDNEYINKNFSYFFDEQKGKYIPLFKNIKLYEGLLLNYNGTSNSILLLHGHQVEYLNDRLWLVSRFLVRYLWKPLELIGVHDPTSTSKNNVKRESVEKKLMKWSAKSNQVIIAGHTHRAVFPVIGEPGYFNDGCCVHPYSITGIEITNGTISLVNWEVKTMKNGTMYVGRGILKGPNKLTDFFTAETV